MSHTRYVKGKIVKRTEGMHSMYAQESIVFNAENNIDEWGKIGGTGFGDPEDYQKKDKEFGIAFSLDLSDKTFVPLGVLDFKNNIENGYFKFNYSLFDESIDSLEFRVLDDKGDALFIETNIKPVTILAGQKQSFLDDMRSKAKQISDPGVKKNIFDINSVLQSYTGASGYTEPGHYSIYWDGFTTDKVYDSSSIAGKRLKAKITATKNGVSKSLEQEFSVVRGGADWIDVKIDRRNKIIDIHLSIDLKNGGAEGLNKDGEVSQEAVDYYKKPPLNKQAVLYQDLERYALDGVEQFWSRHSGNIGKGITIGKDLYQVFVRAGSDEHGMPAPRIVYQTNQEEGRSRNWELSRILYFADGYIYHPGWKKYPGSIIFNTKGWMFGSNIPDFKMTAAHEIGHQILLSYGGQEYSKSHKKSSTIITQEVLDSAPAIPGAGEIDLMKYYQNYYAIPRTIVAEFDVTKLIWLTKLKIQ